MEIVVYIVLMVLVVIGIIKKYKKLMLIGSLSIWLFIVIDFAIIEPYFRYKIV